jgi:hypothetical protein
MATGHALTVGVNRVDRRCYLGRWDGLLRGAENDADAMARIATARGFATVQTLKTEKATCRAVTSALLDAAHTLAPGDLFLLSFSGHGLQFVDIPDAADAEDREPDGWDETWCLYDGQLLDDEIRLALRKFAEGVRVCVVSDSCHSGSVVWFDTGVDALADSFAPTESSSDHSTGATPRAGRRRRRHVKTMPPDMQFRIAAANRGANAVRRLVAESSPDEMRASVLLLSACADDEETADAFPFGVFTRRLLEAWGKDGFPGSYA